MFIVNSFKIFSEKEFFRQSFHETALLWSVQGNICMNPTKQFKHLSCYGELWQYIMFATRVLCIHVHTALLWPELRCRWHNSCHSKWVHMCWPKSLFPMIESMFQKVSSFVCLCVITRGCAVAFPTVVQRGPVSHLIFFARSPIFPDQSHTKIIQNKYNCQNCQSMKLSTWSWICFFPKSNRNLRGTLESSEKKTYHFLVETTGFLWEQPWLRVW